MAKSDVVMQTSFAEFTETQTKVYITKAEEKGREPNERRIARAVARDYLRDFTADAKNLEIVPEIKEALVALFSRKAGVPRAGRSTPKAAIRSAIGKLIQETGTLSENEVFQKSMEAGGAWGRAEMKDFIKRSIKNAEPDNRLWIELQMTEGELMGTYVLVGSGPDAPKGWDGYLPVDTEVDL